MRSVAYLLGRNEALPGHSWTDAACDNRTITLPSVEEATKEKTRFAILTRLVHHETNPLNGRRLIQKHGDRTAVVNPPDLVLSTPELDALHLLAYARRPHPRYRERSPAWEMIRDSVQIMRGCFGGCTFCSITLRSSN